MGSCNIIHDERSEEWIIHEPIVYYELTILIHGFGTLIWNKRDLGSIHLVGCSIENTLNRNYSFYGHGQWVLL